MTPSQDALGRGVLITGASRGIGRAIAHAFAAVGDRVAVHYSSNERDAETTYKALAGQGHCIVQGDLGTAEGAAKIAADAVSALGHVSVLVNNAGVAPDASNRHRVDETAFDAWCEAWRRTIDVNLLGAAHLSWAIAQHLIEGDRGGAIVNVGSRGAFRGEPDYPAYGASKAALHSLGQSMAVVLAPYGISVTSVAPGFIASERQMGKLDGPDGTTLREQSPFGRVGTPDEVAHAVVYLASPDATWSSGTVLDLNGASYLRT